MIDVRIVKITEVTENPIPISLLFKVNFKRKLDIKSSLFSFDYSW